MKKAIIVTLGIATILSMTACGTGKKAVANTQINSVVATMTRNEADVAEVTVATTTTTAVEALNDAKAETRIEITDAANRSFEIAGDKYNFKIPQVTISGVNTDAANAAIKAEIEKDFCDPECPEAFDSNYEYYVGNKTASIVVSNMDLQGGEFIYVKVFNIDINTGKLLSGSEVVKMAGMTDDEFFKNLKTIFTKFDNAEIKRCNSKFEKNYIKENLKKISYKYVQPYFGKDGKLCFIGEVNCTGGAGVSFENFEVV